MYDPRNDVIDFRLLSSSASRHPPRHHVSALCIIMSLANGDAIRQKPRIRRITGHVENQIESYNADRETFLQTRSIYSNPAILYTDLCRMQRYCDVIITKSLLITVKHMHVVGLNLFIKVIKVHILIYSACRCESNRPNGWRRYMISRRGIHRVAMVLWSTVES